MPTNDAEDEAVDDDDRVRGDDDRARVALRGGNRWAYVYGNIDEASHPDMLLEGAALYHATTDGLIPWRQRPDHSLGVFQGPAHEAIRHHIDVASHDTRCLRGEARARSRGILRVAPSRCSAAGAWERSRASAPRPAVRERPYAWIAAEKTRS